jgi:hypothetical protein
VSTLGELLAEHTVLPGGAVDHLHAVVGEWQLLADLSFGDFLMWVRREDDLLVCVSQCRPNTASTVLLTDAVGTVVGQETLLGAVPVRYRGEVVAMLTHQTANDGPRTSSPLENAYLDCAGHLLEMVSEGSFPNVADLALSRSSPRVGDGFIRLDVDGTVTYASPNALSAYHRTRSRPGNSPNMSATRWRAARECGWRSMPAGPRSWCGPCRWGWPGSRPARQC